MRKAAIILAAILGTGAVSASASAEARRCLVAPPGDEEFAPVYDGSRYDPYTWAGYPVNYSNWTRADCAYYDRHFYGASVHFRVRYISRYYR